MSAQLISMRSFRKSQIVLSAHETDPDCVGSIAAARALLAKHLHRMGEDADELKLDYHCLANAMFIEGCSALSENHWSVDEIIEQIRFLEGHGFFETKEEDESA